jgi:dGTPase
MVKHESEYNVSDAREYNPELRENLETQICNVANELAYTSNDLDDGFRSGMSLQKCWIAFPFGNY